MNIGIYGSYSEESLGDHYLLDGIIKQLGSEFDDEPSFIVFSHAPQSTNRLLSGEVESLLATPFDEKSDRSNQSDSDITKDGERDNSYIKSRAKSILDKYPSLWFLFDPICIYNQNFWRKRFEVIKELDLLILGGGNIVMDRFPYGCRYHLIYSTLAKYADVPVVYYGIGAGPLRSVRAKMFYKKAIDNAEFLTTRDETSLKLLHQKLKLGDTRTELSADPAVCLGQEGSKANQRIIENISTESVHIGVSVVPYYMSGYWPVPDDEVYRNYVEGMAMVLDEILDDTSSQITFFATNHPSDLMPAEDIVANISDSDRVSICEERLTSTELIALLNQFDTVLCTRLHSLIPTFVSNTPFIAYNYQPKVRQFCNRIDLEEQVIDLQQPPEKIRRDSEKAFKRAQNWNDSIPDHSERLSKLRRKADLSSKLVREVVNTE